MRFTFFSERYSSPLKTSLIHDEKEPLLSKHYPLLKKNNPLRKPLLQYVKTQDNGKPQDPLLPQIGIIRSFLKNILNLEVSMDIDARFHQYTAFLNACLNQSDMRDLLEEINQINKQYPDEAESVKALENIIGQSHIKTLHEEYQSSRIVFEFLNELMHKVNDFYFIQKSSGEREQQQIHRCD
jgi:hypothetical protein